MNKAPCSLNTSIVSYKNLWIIKKLHVPLPNGLRGNCAIGGSHGPLYLELCPHDDGAVNDDQVWIRECQKLSHHRLKGNFFHSRSFERPA